MKKSKNALDALAADPHKVIALMLWKGRKHEPDLYFKIDEADLKGFEDCVQYLKVTPEVSIERPQGRPAQSATVVRGKTYPAREADPPKPYVIVQLLAKDAKGMTGPLRPVENNEADYEEQRKIAAVRRFRERAPELAARLVRQATTGEFSNSDIQDAAEALMALAQG